MTPEPLTPDELDAIAARYEWRDNPHHMADDAMEDVPALVAALHSAWEERDRLRAALSEIDRRCELMGALPHSALRKAARAALEGSS